MMYRLLSDSVVVLHLGFVLFVIFGGLLALRWHQVMWCHIPAVIWATLVEVNHWICPLTPLELWLHHQAGDQGYQSDFLAHYVFPLLYPENLTRTTQTALGFLVFTLNIGLYGWIFRKGIKKS